MDECKTLSGGGFFKRQTQTDAAGRTDGEGRALRRSQSDRSDNRESSGRSDAANNLSTANVDLAGPVRYHSPRPRPPTRMMLKSDEASNICQARCPPSYRHAFKSPRFMGYMASYDVASNMCPARCPPSHRHASSNPCFLGYMASYDTASTKPQTLNPKP